MQRWGIHECTQTIRQLDGIIYRASFRLSHCLYFRTNGHLGSARRYICSCPSSRQRYTGSSRRDCSTTGRYIGPSQSTDHGAYHGTGRYIGPGTHRDARGHDAGCARGSYGYL